MGHGGQDNPEHRVFLTGFWIYRTKVTNDMYARCVASGKCTPPGPDAALPDYTDPRWKDHPVVGITWDQAANYCKWVQGRLPTEAEWEKAARGPNGKLYPWGDAQPSCNLANHANCVGHPTHVLAYPDGVSEYEAFDFSGNTFEWVSDWYKPTYYSESPQQDPTGPEMGTERAVRGSAYTSSTDQLFTFLRYYYDPQKFRPDLGFRCVIEDPQQYAPPCEVSPFVGEPATGPGGSSTTGEAPNCEPPAPIRVETYCRNKIPYANVFPEGADLDLGSGDCSRVSNFFVCTGINGGSYQMTACTTCEPPGGLPAEASPSCPAGYIYDEAACTCRYQPQPGSDSPSGTICPSSLFLAALLIPDYQCCELPLPQPNEDKPFCDPGYIPDGCMCVSGAPESGLAGLSCIDFTVSLPICDKPHGSNCSGCSCYTNEKECLASGQCKWDPVRNICG